MGRIRINFTKKSYVFLDAREEANFKALVDFFKNSEENSFTMNDIMMGTHKKHKKINKYINFKSLRSMVYFMLGSHNLVVQQRGRARIITTTTKLRDKLR